MKTITWSFRTPVNLSGNTVDAVDTSVSQAWLRRFTEDSGVYTYAEQIPGTAVGSGTGRFIFDITTEGYYQLWISAYPDTSASNRRDEFHGGSGKYAYITDDSLPYLPLDPGTSNYTAGTGKIINLGNATADTDALNRQTGDSRYFQKTANNSLSGDNTFSGTTTLEDTLTMFGAVIDMDGNKITNLPDSPSADNDAASKLYVDTQVAGVIVTPYQESPNEIRLIPGGTTKTGQVYTTWNAAIGYLKSLTPSATKRFVINIGGMGITGATSIVVTENDGGSPPTAYFESYVSFFLKNRFIKLEIPDDAMSVIANTVSIEGGTIYKNDGGANPSFTNFRFVNVYFDLTVNTVTFENCRFENCFIKVNDDSDGTATFTNCKGSGTISNQDFPTTIKGWAETPKEDF